jgi:hypothetical protein
MNTCARQSAPKLRSMSVGLADEMRPRRWRRTHRASEADALIGADRLEPLRARFRDCVILLPGTTADADGAHYFSIAFQRDSTGENHHSAMIGNVNPEKLIARLGMLGEVFRRDIESAGSERLVNRNVDASDPGSVHTDVRNQVSAAIDDGDVHRLLNFLGFLFRCCNDSARIRKCDHISPILLRRAYRKAAYFFPVGAGSG